MHTPAACEQVHASMVIKCIEEDVNKVVLTVRPASYPTTCHSPFHALYSDGASVVCGGDGAVCVLVMPAYDACGQHVVNHRAAVRVASVRRVRGLRVSFGSLSHLLLGLAPTRCYIPQEKSYFHTYIYSTTTMGLLENSTDLDWVAATQSKSVEFSSNPNVVFKFT